MKTCTLCGDRLPLDQFPPDTRNADGRAGRCRDCHNHAREASAAGAPAPLRAPADTSHLVGPPGHGVCVCARPIPRGTVCARCLVPIVGLMHPDNRAKMDRKWTGWRTQELVT